MRGLAILPRARRVGGRPVLALIAYGLPSVLIAAPLLLFLTYGFWSVEDGRIVHAFTLRNYAAFFQDPMYPRVFAGSLVLAGGVAALATPLGYVVAYLVWRLEGRLRYSLLLLSAVPLAMNYVVKIYAMRGLLGYDGYLNQALVSLGVLAEPSRLFLYNQTAVLITMTVIYLPYAILPIFLSLERISPALVQASADLGAVPGATFRHVVLPLSAPGCLAAGLFVALLTLGDFLTPQMVGGIRGFTFGSVIWSQFGLAYDWPQGVALGVVLLVAVLTLAGGASLVQLRKSAP